ncbi:hypothetical protein D4752_20620 [Vibrio parahaemolyticus]|nr:hypothetical protein D4752_20620 [Vibrio parahaemolyticus]
MLVKSIRAATHEPPMRFKTDVTEARQRVVDLAVAEVRKKAEQGETGAELSLDHIVNAKYQLVDLTCSPLSNPAKGSECQM